MSLPIPLVSSSIELVEMRPSRHLADLHKRGGVSTAALDKLDPRST